MQQELNSSNRVSDNVEQEKDNLGSPIKINISNQSKILYYLKIILVLLSYLNLIISIGMVSLNSTPLRDTLSCSKQCIFNTTFVSNQCKENFYSMHLNIIIINFNLKIIFSGIRFGLNFTSRMKE